jgi:hypothetical protein
MNVIPLLMTYGDSSPTWFKYHAKQLSFDRIFLAEFHFEMSQMNYLDYLQTDTWKVTRQIQIRRQPKCQRCGRVFHLEANHLTYQPIGIEILSLDTCLETLCRDCHAEAPVPPRHMSGDCKLCELATSIVRPVQLKLPMYAPNYAIN